MATEVGSAYVTILPSARGFGRALNKQVGPPLKNGGQQSGKDFGKSFSLAALPGIGAATAAIGGLGIGALLKSSVELEAAFSKTMNTLSAATGATGQDMQNLSALAMKMGADTSFSANEAADAMLELAKSGISPADIQAGALKGTLTLAAAGATDLGTASTIASNAMNAFGLAGKDMDSIAAALAGGANASSASVESLGEALQQVGPGAVNAGLSLQDTVGALSAFDAMGIKGSDAGTSLKTMLSRLVPSTDAASGAMKKLGLDFTDASGKFVPITNVAEQLRLKLGKLSEEQRTAALTTIFGSDATRAATVLMKQGATGLQKYIDATKDTEAANRMAAAATSGTAGALERMSGAVETAKLGLGRVLAPAVVASADAIGGVAGRIATAMDKFGPKVIAVGTGIRRQVTTALSGVGKDIAASIDLKGVGEKFKAGAAEGATGIINALIDTFNTADWGQIGRVAGTGVATALQAAVGGALDLTAALGGLITRIKWGDLAMAIGRQVPTMLLGLATGIINFDIGPIFTFVANHWIEVLVGILTIFFGGAPLANLLGKIPLVGPILRWLVKAIQGVGRPVVDAVGRFIGDMAGAFLRGIASRFPQIGGGLGKALALLPTRIGVAALDAMEAVGRWIASVRAAFISGAGRIGGAVGDVLMSVLRAIGRGFNTIIGGAVRGAGMVISGLARAFSGGVRAVVGAVDRLTGGMLSRIAGNLRAAAGSAAARAGEIVGRIAGAITNGLGNIGSAVGRIGSAIVNAAAGFGGLLIHAGEDLVRGFINGIGNMAGAAADAARNMASSAVDAAKGLLHISSPSKVFHQIGQYVSQGFANGITKSADAAKTAAQRLANITTDAVAGRRGGIVAIVANDNKKIGVLLKNRAGILNDLAKATEKYKAIRDTRNQTKEGLQSGIIGAGDVTQAAGGGASGVLANLKGALAQSRKYAANLATLQKRGLNKTAIAQIVAAGVEQGSGAAQALAGATDAELKEINKTQKALVTAAKSTGDAAADTLYGAGVKAAKGLVDGLKNQQKNIEDRMLIIAKAMKDAIKKALGIHSPSRVFHDLGTAVADGLALGIDSGHGQVAAATSRLAGAATLSAVPTFGSTPATAGASAATYVRVQIGERDLTDIVRVEQDRRDATFADALAYRAA